MSHISLDIIYAGIYKDKQNILTEMASEYLHEVYSVIYTQPSAKTYIGTHVIATCDMHITNVSNMCHHSPPNYSETLAASHEE